MCYTISGERCAIFKGTGKTIQLSPVRQSCDQTIKGKLNKVKFFKIVSSSDLVLINTIKS